MTLNPELWPASLILNVNHPSQPNLDPGEFPKGHNKRAVGKALWTTRMKTNTHKIW